MPYDFKIAPLESAGIAQAAPRRIQNTLELKHMTMALNCALLSNADASNRAWDGKPVAGLPSLLIAAS
jgi:hypothetical protein